MRNLLNQFEFEIKTKDENAEKKPFIKGKWNSVVG